MTLFQTYYLRLSRVACSNCFSQKNGFYHSFNPKKTQAVSAVSPLALLTCGGGGGGGGSSSFSVSGHAVAGPITGAVAFVDYDKDGTLDADEPYDYTDASGAFALTSAQADAQIVVTTAAQQLAA